MSRGFSSVELNVPTDAAQGKHPAVAAVLVAHLPGATGAAKQNITGGGQGEAAGQLSGFYSFLLIIF